MCSRKPGGTWVNTSANEGKNTIFQGNCEVARVGAVPNDSGIDPAGCLAPCVMS